MAPGSGTRTRSARHLSCPRPTRPLRKCSRFRFIRRCPAPTWNGSSLGWTREDLRGGVGQGVGLPLAVQCARKGHDVIGVDVKAAVVDSVNAGIAPFPGEPGLPELLAQL